MSIERMAGQGYAPIPQCMSNTDTEDEDERLAIPIENLHQDQAKIHVSIVTLHFCSCFFNLSLNATNHFNSNCFFAYVQTLPFTSINHNEN